jgi:hypothetical protein
MNSLVTLVQVSLLGAAFLIALFYFGFGATRFLLPPTQREWRALITPFVGLALVVVWDYLALFFGINLTIGTLLLLGAATAVNAAAAVRSFPDSLPLLTKRDSHSAQALLPKGKVGWALFAVALVTFLAAIAPLVRYGYITIIGENWDYEFYLPLADSLETTATGALAQLPPNPLMNVVLSRHIFPLPMGFSYLQSSLDVLFRLEAIDSFAVLLAVVRALGVVSAFVFFRATLRMGRPAALAASGLLGLNGLLLWATYWNYGLHLTSLALLPIALTFGVEALLPAPGQGGDRINPGRNDARFGLGRNGMGFQFGRSGLRPLLLAALFLAAINVTYHPTLIVALLPLAGLGLYLLVARRERLRTLSAGIGLIILTIGLSFPALFHIKDFVREYYGREPLATGLREFIPLTDAYGLSQYSLELVVGHTIPTPILYDLATRVWSIAAPVLLALALAASAFALWRLWRNPLPALGSVDDERRAVWFILVAASVFYIAVFRLPFLHPYPYGFMKSLTLVSFILIALVVEGIARGERQGARGEGREAGDKGKSAKSKLGIWNPEFGTLGIRHSTLGVFLSLYALLTLFTFGITLEQYFKPAPPFFNADDLKVRALEGMLPHGAAVFLTDRSDVQRIPMGLAAYALRDFPLYGKVSTGYGEMNDMAPGAVYDYALLARGEDPSGRGYQAPPLWSNNKFALYAKAPGVVYHRTVNASAANPGVLTFTLGPSQVVTGTQTVSSTPATRGVNIALASFVPQTVTLTIGGTPREIVLAPGLSVYRIPQARLPAALTVETLRTPNGSPADATSLPPEPLPLPPHATPLPPEPSPLPSHATQADADLFVPWIELRDASGGVESNTLTNALLIRCTSAAGTALDARCFVANPGGAAIRWEYVVRGTPKGTREDEELVRRGAPGSPRQVVDIQTDAFSGQLRLRFDDRTPASFSSPKLEDGDYRAALEVFRDKVMVAEINLYTFVISKNGTSLTRESPRDPPLVVINDQAARP